MSVISELTCYRTPELLLIQAMYSNHFLDFDPAFHFDADPDPTSHFAEDPDPHQIDSNLQYWPPCANT
jgi:hypothetical protein